MIDGNRDAYGMPTFAPDCHKFSVCALLEGAKRIGDPAKVRWILTEIIAESMRTTHSDIADAVVSNMSRMAKKMKCIPSYCISLLMLSSRVLNFDARFRCCYYNMINASMVISTAISLRTTRTIYAEPSKCPFSSQGAGAPASDPASIPRAAEILAKLPTTSRGFWRPRETLEDTPVPARYPGSLQGTPVPHKVPWLLARTPRTPRD